MSGQSEEKIYKIGQAAKLVGLKSYVLRFWEGEFEQLKPIRTPSGQRLYNDSHITLISTIKALLHDEGMTIEGARKRLESMDSEVPAAEEGTGRQDSVEQLPLFSNAKNDEFGREDSILREIRSELLAIRKLLD